LRSSKLHQELIGTQTATRVNVRVNPPGAPKRITVVDNGHGMSADEFENRWLIIGRITQTRKANE